MSNCLVVGERSMGEIMKVELDQEMYKIIASSYTKEVVKRLVVRLDEEKLVHFDVFNIDEDSINLIYSLSFDFLVSLEDFSGFDLDSQTFIAHCLFSDESDSPVNPKVLYSSDKRIDLHGGLTDELILEAIEEVKQDRLQ